MIIIQYKCVFCRHTKPAGRERRQEIVLTRVTMHKCNPPGGYLSSGVLDDEYLWHQTDTHEQVEIESGSSFLYLSHLLCFFVIFFYSVTGPFGWFRFFE